MAEGSGSSLGCEVCLSQVIVHAQSHPEGHVALAWRVCALQGFAALRLVLRAHSLTPGPQFLPASGVYGELVPSSVDSPASGPGHRVGQSPC